MQRTKNASRNIIFGTILKLYQIAVPLFIRTVINYILGIEYLGAERHTDNLCINETLQALL